MNEMKRTIRSIHGLCCVSIVFVCIIFMVAFVSVVEHKTSPSSLLNVCGRMYIIIQIDRACRILQKGPLFPISIKKSIKKVAVCYMVMGGGSFIIDTIYESVRLGKLHICLNLTVIGIGFLLLVGSYIYGYGCEMQDENDLTV